MSDAIIPNIVSSISADKQFCQFQAYKFQLCAEGWGLFRCMKMPDNGICPELIRCFTTLEELKIWYEMEGYSLDDLYVEDLHFDVDEIEVDEI